MPNCFTMIDLKWSLLQDIIDKKRKIKEVAEILKLSRQSISIYLKKYKEDWINWIIPKKPWPKWWETHNKTKYRLEKEIVRLAKENPFEWPIWISDEIHDIYDIKIDQSTVYRILKRTNTRYYYWYYWSRKKRKLYVKDIPWRELQLDVSFPYWYQRKLAVYTAIDDASRYVVSKIYTNHTEYSTLDFVKEVISKSKYRVRAFRTDQWREFSRKITNYLYNLWIDHNKNPPYTPQHNWKVERYHRTMKEKCCVYWKFKSSIEELNYDLKLWTYYYNWTKRHYWLWMNWLSPEKRLEKFKQENPLLVTLF
jgi:transposase InsO family protein